MKKYFYLILGIFITRVIFGQHLEAAPDFSRLDRILILAPHPDDEILGTGGVIQKTLSAGGKVKVVLYTCGEHNQLAFLFYCRRLVLKQKGFLSLGSTRIAETREAVGYLGLKEEDVVFLGYPDLGTLSILTRHWGANVPYRDLLTRIAAVPYPVCLSPGAPYTAESILNDLKRVILDFKPTQIFVSSPLDSNGDHVSLYVFLRLALWDLESRIPDPEIYPYLVHYRGWPRPLGYHPDLELTPPSQLNNSVLSWEGLNLEPQEVEQKWRALSFYQSQLGYSRKLLFSFARKNELFDCPPLIKAENRTESQKNVSSGLNYFKENQNLVVWFKLNRKIPDDFRLSFFLFPYRRGEEVSRMPKIYLSLTERGLSITNKAKRVFNKSVRVEYPGKKELVLKIPLSFLGQPDYILVRPQINSGGDLPPESLCWRIVEVTSPRFRR